MDKDNIVKLVEEFIGLVNIFSTKSKKPLNYGTEYKIYMSEIHTLEVIVKYPEENASFLSNKLSITNGALTQVVSKLASKNLVETYNKNGNKKEVFFKPTSLGLEAHKMHMIHDEKLITEDFSFLKEMSIEEISLVTNFIKKAKKAFK